MSLFDIYFIKNAFICRFSDDFLIESQRLNGTDRKLLIRVKEKCLSIAYDWTGNNIFCTFPTRIDVFSLNDTSIRKTLIHVPNIQ